MNEQDKPKFALLLSTVAELYHKKLSTSLLTLYWQALKRFELSQIQRAIAQHVNNPEAGQFMVKPSDIIRTLEGTRELRALQAWSKVESAIRHIGSYSTVVFDDPIIHVVIQDMGGWVKVCSTKLTEIPFQVSEFIKRYVGYLQRESLVYPSYLKGIYHQSPLSQLLSSQPALVGDIEKAKQVLQQGSQARLPIYTQMPLLTLKEPEHE